MDTRSQGYLAKKHATLKEQAFQYLQSRSQFSEEYKTPQLLTQSRPRTRSTNAADKHVDIVRHPPPPPPYSDYRFSDSRYSDNGRVSGSATDLHRPSTDLHRPSTDLHRPDFHRSSEYQSRSSDYRAGGDPALRVPIPGRSPVVQSPATDPVISRSRPRSGYRPRPRSIATDIGYNKMYDRGPVSPEYETGYRSSTSNLLHSNNQSVGRSGEGQNGDVRKWGSCSRLEYNGQPGYGHYPVPGHERTEGDGGPASYPEPYNNQYTEPAYNPYNRRHSSSKMSSHSNNSDEVILAQKAELEEKNRVIESLKMRMTDGDSKLTERAYSDKSGEHGAVAESLDSGIDIRSETGVMKPLFGGQRTSSDERNELAKLRLYVKQLEAKVDSGVSSSYEEESKVENLLKDNQKLIDEKTSISRKFARLQDYLTTLPTVNEYTKLQEQLTQLTEENTNLQEEQKRVTESSKDVKLKDADMKKYQKKCTDMRESIMKLEKQNNLLKSQNANQAKQELQKVELEKSKMEKKMEQLKKEISVLSEQKESTKSLVGGYYEKFNNEQEKTKILTQSLENSVNEVEDLRSELDRRIHQEEELQGRISDLERELEAVLLKMEEYESQENRDVENSELLMAEYNAAFQDLNSVVEVCQMRVQGQQLDISLLLGLGASPRPSNKEDLTVESQLRNIQALRSNIENIRTLLSDLYAEDIGSQCPTQ
ncbi:centrosomal protein of 85 kDa-like isoform X5 [Bolinopsis microptera]|uniref:centrosomal protein of 85 kDa-like isoform X5 n=1 Tax=Bolinopsis microptera TaxID=2820187 RepID=UPI00307A1239